MARRGSPRLAETVRALRRLASAYAARGTDALPSVADLAGRMGVSQVTAWKAVRALCAEGVLRSHQGRGTYVVGAVPDNPAPGIEAPAQGPELLSGWERVRDRIVADHCVPDPDRQPVLPSCKTLVARYGTSHRTLRRALADLVARKRIVAHGRTYRIAGPLPSRPSDTVVLVARGNRLGQISFRYPNEAEHVRGLEKSCGARGIRLLTALVDPDGRLLQDSAAMVRALRRTPPLGYLLWLPGPAGRSIDGLLRELRCGSTPAAVGADTARLEEARTVRNTRTVRGFAMPDYGYQAGVTVGRQLVDTGHRQVICLHPHDENERMIGVSDAVERAGGTVCHCTYKPPPRAPTEGPGHFNDVYRRYVGLVREHVPHSANHDMLSDALPALGLEVRKEAWQQALTSAVADALGAVPASFQATAVAAWHDPCAIACRHVLASMGSDVPRGISLISFDDTLEASLADIASYNDNASHVLHAMLDWVLWPDLGRSAAIVLPEPGFVTLRGSLRRVGRRP